MSKNPMNELQDAEDFFAYFQVPFHPQILNVSRMHILKTFRSYLEDAGLLDADSAIKDVWRTQRAYLFRAYGDFVKPTPVRKKFFPEFYKNYGTFIPFSDIKKLKTSDEGER
ncbi:nitrogenase-stabilizing/protective protein NifW [Amphibacillus cookii]|uniref:nitrogenase-stabilizing/protective protein NifW n=1 Tax=Amphibacillus cookii TaxID=767787 RepID=UPI00195A77FF|nr:nitrogenase-stabilizing/protective protein NifW [Amphibacillus cookii]MBM7541898.1 nitrogenase-stabilizing/protective protein [Amphibacillus cookii]